MHLGRTEYLNTRHGSVMNKIKVFSDKDNVNITIFTNHSFKGTKENSGLFHLAEHLLFNDIKIGDKSYSNTDLINHLKTLGVEVNARTSHDSLQIVTTILTPRVHKNTPWTKKYTEYTEACSAAIEFINGIHAPKILDAEVLEKEKNIVISELTMCGYDAYRDCVANGAILGISHNVLGTIDEIKKAKLSTIQNILDHIYSGLLYEDTTITCNIKRHALMVARLEVRLGVKDYVLVDKLNEYKNCSTHSKNIIEKFSVNSLCPNIPNTRPKSKDIEPIVLNKKLTTMYIGLEIGCKFNKNADIETNAKKFFMMSLLNREMIYTNSKGICNVLREDEGLIYGFSNIATRGDISCKNENIPALSAANVYIATIGGTDDVTIKSTHEMKDRILLNVIQPLAKNYTATITPEYFESIMRGAIHKFSEDANYNTLSCGYLSGLLSCRNIEFMSEYYKCRVDEITREEYIAFAKEHIAKMQWYMVAV